LYISVSSYWSGRSTLGLPAKKGALIMMREQSIDQIMVLSYISVSSYWS
jgi:hypothetical protein